MKKITSLFLLVFELLFANGQVSTTTEICTDTLVLKNYNSTGQLFSYHKPIFSIKSNNMPYTYVWSIGIGYPGSYENYLKISPTSNLDNFVAAYNTDGIALASSKSLQLNIGSRIISNPLGEAYKYGFNESIQATEITTGNRFRLMTAGSATLVTTQNGNVGIGISEPMAKLDINGSMKLNGGSVIQKIQVGEQLIEASSTRLKIVTITFPSAFTSIPKIVCTPKNTVSNSNEMFCVTIRSIDINSVTINIMRIDENAAWTQDVLLSWHTWE
ncbi:MAG: hypothetical protein WBP45_09270 [Daejeonella sp.]